MLTIVTTVRPLERKDYLRAFRNAIRSWRRLNPVPEILVFGKGKRTQKIVEKERGCFVSDYTPYGRDRPYFDEFIRVSERLAANSLLMYCTDHLILGAGLMGILRKISETFPEHLMVVGQHLKLGVRGVDFSSTAWERALRKRVRDPENRAGPSAKDFIVFRRPLELEVPKFIMGYPRYDSWLVWAALEANHPVVDITGVFAPIHQAHAFVEGSLKARYEAPGSTYNHRLSKAIGFKGQVGTTEDATYVFTPEGLIRRS